MGETRTAAVQYCLIGGNVSHSPSPAMMNAAFSAAGIRATYLTVNVEVGQLPEKFRELKQAGVRGMNVTIPFKNSIMPLLDKLDEVSSRIGAVNVVESRNGKYTGHNTDVDGVMGPLSARFPDLLLRHSLVLGAGGASRAFLEAMRRMGCAKVTVAVRDKSRAATFIEEMTRACEGLEIELRSLRECGSIRSSGSSVAAQKNWEGVESRLG